MMLASNVTKMVNVTNPSIDGFADGCFQHYNTVACARDAMEAVVALVTAIVCIAKIVKLHIVKHELWNQYIIFYSAVVEIVLLTLNWMYLHHAAVDLVAELLKLTQFIVVCRFYCEIASRMAKTENLYKRFLLPALVATLVYFVVLILVGIIKLKENKEECAEPEWVCLSISEVVLGIISIVVGIYITKKTNNLKTDSSYKRNIKLSLWGIILSFQISSLISMTYDLLMLFVGKKNQCKGIFVKSAVAFTISHIFVKLGKWLLPIWAMIIIYKPDSFQGNTEIENSEHPPIVHRSSVGVFKSEFRPRGKSFNYKHLRDPANEKERDLLTGPKVEHFQDKKTKKKRKKRTGDSSSHNSPTSPQDTIQEKNPRNLIGINADPIVVSGRNHVA